MKTNKLKLLMVSLFLSNVKSVHLQKGDGSPYRYEQRQSDINMTQQPNHSLAGVTISDLEFVVNQNIELIMSDILKLFLKEISLLPNDNCTFTIQNTFDGTKQTYRATKENNLITIKIDSPDQDIIINEDINHTVLALLYMNSDNMQSFFKKNSADNINIPNSNVYIYRRNWLVTNTMKHCYYIFEENNIEAKNELKHLLQTTKAENQTIMFFDRRNFTFQNAMLLLNFFMTTIVSIMQFALNKK